jgi:hypothetical protein
MERRTTLSLVRTRSTASPFAPGRDAFHCVPLFRLRGFRDAVESVLTNEWDAVERVPTMTWQAT